MTAQQQPRVPFDDCEYADSLELLHDGTPFTGIVEERHPDGRLLSESEYWYGIPHGTTRVFHPNGTVRLEENFEQGLRTLRREWTPAGRLVREIVYERGTVTTDRARDDQRPEVAPDADPPGSSPGGPALTP